MEDLSSQAIHKSKPQLQMIEAVDKEVAEPKVEKEDKHALVYRFKQQLINAWRPVPSLSSSIVLYLVLTSFFAAIGGVMFILTFQEYKFQTRYDDDCTVYNTACTVTIEVTEDVEPPIYFYYGLTNLNQNQRFFANSKSEYQLEQGQQFSSYDSAAKYCGSKTTNGQIGWVTSVDGNPLNSDDVAFPCGLIAYSFFNDTYSIMRSNDSLGISISETGIAWPGDKDIYKNYNTSVQGIDVTNEHWLVWLRPASTSSFYKLWGVINSKLWKSNYTLTVSNSYKIDFSQKWFKMSKTNVFGDSNLVLSIAYLACVGICLVLLLGFVMGKIRAQFK